MEFRRVLFRSHGKKIRTRLLGLKQIYRHSAEERWKILQPLLAEYDSIDSLGVIIGDNETTNDKLCRLISSWFMNEQGVDWNAETSRIRCIGHIINLIVRSEKLCVGKECV